MRRYLRIVENADSAPEDRVVFHTEWLPGKAESRRPKNIVQALERSFLINEDRLIIRLIGIMTDCVKGSGQTRKASRFAHEIRLMLRADRHRYRQSGAGTPFILNVDPQVVP